MKILSIVLLLGLQSSVLLGMGRVYLEAPAVKRPKLYDVEMLRADLGLPIEGKKVEKIFPQMDDSEFFDLLKQDFDFWFYNIKNKDPLHETPNPEDRELVFQRFLTLSDDMFLYCCTDSGRQHSLSYDANGRHYVFNSYVLRDDFRERVCKLGDEDFKELMDCSGPYGSTVFMNIIGCFTLLANMDIDKSNAIIYQFWNRIKRLPKNMELKVLNQSNVYIIDKQYRYRQISLRSYFESVQDTLPKGVRDEINKFYAESMS